MQRSKTPKEERLNSRADQKLSGTCEFSMETEEQHSSSRTGKLSSTRCPRGLKTLDIYHHDFPREVARHLGSCHRLAIDTEGGGLNFRTGVPTLIQIATEDGKVIMVRFPDWKSDYLKGILESHYNKLIFHYALGDLRMLKVGLGVDFRGKIECTRVLRKITNPTQPAGLASSLRMALGINVSKTETQSDWSVDTLSEDQILYAAGDVIYLHKLADKLEGLLPRNVRHRYLDAMNAIKYKARLEVEGYTGLLDFEKDHGKAVLNYRTWWQNRVNKWKEKR